MRGGNIGCLWLKQERDHTEPLSRLIGDIFTRPLACEDVVVRRGGVTTLYELACEASEGSHLTHAFPRFLS